MAKERSTLFVGINSRGAVVGARKYTGSIKRMVGSTKKAKSSFGGLKTAAVALFAVLGSRAILRRIITAVSEQEESIAQLRAGLESTNSVSGQTVKSIRDVAAEMQRTTRFSNEAVEGIAGIGLSFTNISGDVFPRFLRVSADVATRMGTGLRDTAVQLAKALNDPIANLGALSRAGIQFSKEQKETIKTLVESNKTMEAQNLILNELERQYRGSAAAAKDTLGGSVEGLKNNMDDLTKAIGQALAPMLRVIIDQLNDVIVGFTEMIRQAHTAQEVTRETLKGTQIVPIEPVPTAVPERMPQLIQAGLPRPKEAAGRLSELTNVMWQFEDSLDAVGRRMEEQRRLMSMSQRDRAAVIAMTKEWTRAEEKLRGELTKANIAFDTQDEVVRQLKQTSQFFTDQIGREAQLLADHREELKKFQEVSAVFDSVKSSVSGAFTDIVVGAKSAQDALTDMANNITRMLVRIAIQKAIAGIGPTAPTIPTGADGLIALANGGIVNGPTPALIGERGPEAVIPLRKDEQGRLGVSGGKGGDNVTNITLVGDPVSTMDMLTHDPKILQNMMQNWKQGYALD